jgi:hypothetical protein
MPSVQHAIPRPMEYHLLPGQLMVLYVERCFYCIHFLLTCKSSIYRPNIVEHLEAAFATTSLVSRMGVVVFWSQESKKSAP